jgi:hypothetical protein
MLDEAHAGRKIEGLLFNSRMVQAIFDDENPATAAHWRYPDTGFWDADRNTDEFCAMLPVYAQHGVLGVTVGLQGGGSSLCPAYLRPLQKFCVYSSWQTKTGLLRTANPRASRC